MRVAISAIREKNLHHISVAQIAVLAADAGQHSQGIIYYYVKEEKEDSRDVFLNDFFRARKQALRLLKDPS